MQATLVALSKAPTSDFVHVEVWQHRQLAPVLTLKAEPPVVDLQDYRHVATVALPSRHEQRQIRPAVALEMAWSRAQNIDSDWNPASPTRSCAVGDLFRIVGHPDVSVQQWWATMAVGFSPVRPSTGQTSKQAPLR